DTEFDVGSFKAGPPRMRLRDIVQALRDTYTRTLGAEYMYISDTPTERYLHTKYVGQKRFSAEGGDTMIPMLDHLIQRAGAAGVGEIVLGMAHRGRLNVLVNTLGKMPTDLFSEFEGKVV